MRLSLRFLVPLALVISAFAYAAVPLMDRMTLAWFKHDLDLRATLVANAVEDPLAALLAAGNKTQALKFLKSITQDERIYGMALCQGGTKAPLAVPALPRDVDC